MDIIENDDKEKNRIKEIKDGLTFDDVLIIPAKAKTKPQDISLKTKLTRSVTLNIPLASAALETVTESNMAIAIARQGGIGIIHRNMSPESQAIEVDKVKRSQHGVITDPFFLSPNDYVYDADNLMAKYKISGVPICENGKLVGIITNRDLRFESDINKKIYEIMTSENLITAPEGTTLTEAKRILALNKIEKLPIVDKNNKLKGLITTKDINKSIKYPNASHDSSNRLLVGASVGVGENILDRVKLLLEAKADVIVIDDIYGYTPELIDTVKLVKKNFPDAQLIAGNVVTPDAVEELINAGADAIKIGFGTSSVSAAHIISGVGVPQLTAVLNCSMVAKKYGVPIISDGGIKYSGDITKVLAAGANVCMLGNMFAGCEESPGQIELYQGRKYKIHKGLAENNLEIVEGRVGYSGELRDITNHLMEGLKSGLYYCGAETIEKLQQTAEFIKITSAGVNESHPHGIQITRETHNYHT